MSNFWSKHAGGNATPTTRSSDLPLAPSQRPMDTYQQPQQQPTGRPMGSVSSSGACPECRSGNYMKVGSIATQNGPQDAWRCYDCGYPKVQSGSGAGMPSGSSSGSATPAKQPAKGSGFNPNVIVDRIG